MVFNIDIFGNSNLNKVYLGFFISLPISAFCFVCLSGFFLLFCKLYTVITRLKKFKHDKNMHTCIPYRCKYVVNQVSVIDMKNTSKKQ